MPGRPSELRRLASPERQSVVLGEGAISAAGRAPDTSPTTSPAESAPPSELITPRLLNLRAAANYLGVSPWTIRDLEARGVLKRVTVPLPGGAELRKLLFDKLELDRLIDVWKA